MREGEEGTAALSMKLEKEEEAEEMQAPIAAGSKKKEGEADGK